METPLIISLILKEPTWKNKIIIPKEFKTSFFKENFTKPISKLKTNIVEFKEEKIKDKNRFFRRIENYKYDTSRKVNHEINNLWKNVGNVGINFLQKPWWLRMPYQLRNLKLLKKTKS